VYAELIRKKEKTGAAPNKLLFYPFVGDVKIESDTTRAWNSSKFTLCPVRMNKQVELKDALPSDVQKL
jgi:hypothetical protein